MKERERREKARTKFLYSPTPVMIMITEEFNATVWNCSKCICIQNVFAGLNTRLEDSSLTNILLYIRNVKRKTVTSESGKK